MGLHTAVAGGGVLLTSVPHSQPVSCCCGDTSGGSQPCSNTLWSWEQALGARRALKPGRGMSHLSLGRLLLACGTDGAASVGLVVLRQGTGKLWQQLLPTYRKQSAE